jgi:hypothetical protein
MLRQSFASCLPAVIEWLAELGACCVCCHVQGNTPISPEATTLLPGDTLTLQVRMFM